MARKSDAMLGFDALSIEGGLLSPVWLGKVAQLLAGGQEPGDYRIPKGLSVRDEIGRYWRIAQAHWAEFKAGGAAAPQALAERFVTAFLREVLGFASLATSAGLTVGDHTWPVRHSALGGRVPVIIAPAGAGLETPDAAFGDDGRRRTAFGLLQEFLNAEDRALWGIASDGRTLRIARDNASLTRPAWIEADLASIFADERYADFAAFWLLAHESRFGAADRPPTDCPLETWRNAGREEGTRAREHLREGVEDALLALGNGFLGHAGNQPLRESLRTNALTRDAFFQQLLRLVYRLIFLITAEERGVLHAVRDTPETGRYAEGYSLRRLRERAVRRSAHDRFSDLWQGLLIVLRGLAAGESRLALPALAGLFARDQCTALDVASLENRALLRAVYRLCWLRDDAGLVRVNWRDMGPEELGSVYESLLELVPRISPDGRTFSFAAGDQTRGNARKSSGSYYTPDSLVQVLLDSALEPVVADTIARNPGNSVEALLSLSIVDPACGSGHFLLAAARRVAAHVARLQANGTPSPPEYRHALRQVVGRCIYGVDLNPMAVELCKVSLWMEAVEPGLPLTFLDSHVQHGNALLGATPELIAKGVPDAAWESIEGDDRKTASALKKRNKAERADQNLSFEFAPGVEGSTMALASQVQMLDAASDESLAGIQGKEVRWQALLESQHYAARRLAADTWCAAYVWRKQPGDLANVAPTHNEWERIRHDPVAAPTLLVDEVQRLAGQYCFFHWHLQFPQVFAKGGFDVVLGNPPWERVKLQEQEFFASRHDEIANAPNAAARKKLIAALPESDPQLWKEWCAASRRAEGESHLVRDSGRYPLCGKGDVNTYSVFAEHDRVLMGADGSVGVIVPTGIATDDTTKEYFQAILTAGHMESLFDFQTGPETFGNLAHGALRFCLLTLRARSRKTGVDLFFLAKSATDLRMPERHLILSPADFQLLNPNTRTCPTFLSRRDADINLAIYRRTGVLLREDDEQGNPWGLRFMRMLDMANDSALFRTRAELEPKGDLLPLFEAKMVDHFDHRYASLIGVENGAGRISRKLVGWYSAMGENPDEFAQPQYWVARREVDERLAGKWDREWLLGWRDICRSTDQRTVIASLIPRAGVGDKFLLMMPSAEPPLIAALYANLCSFALDYCARQKFGGTSLKYFTMKQLPVLAPNTYQAEAAWSRRTRLRDWLLPRVIELTYTAWDLEPFARDVGYDGPPFRWDLERRFLLRCELDAAFFHLYGLSRDDTAYVMDTFPILKRRDEKTRDGKFRTKDIILEIFNEMAEAARTGKPYQTRLSPPPADPRVAHPPREGGKVIPLPVKPATRPQPAIAPAAGVVPDLAAVAANLWARPHTMERGEIQVAILAVLKANGAPMDRRQARLAALLCLEPHLLGPMLDRTEKTQWARVVGNDAKKAASASIDATSQDWGAALTGLRGRGRLLEDLQQNTWALGIGTDAINTSGWPEGRAGFVLNMLRRLQPSTQVDALILKLPLNVQQWLANAA
jgi:hypothetical protein